jgi:hypothetical protein
MAGDPLRIVTEEQRERLHTARNRGGQCAACGRSFAVDEPVYIEQFLSSLTIYTEAPVGVECASPAFLRAMEDVEPERCAGCGRPVYYHFDRRRRHLVACSRRCRSRAHTAQRSARIGEAG